MRLQGDEVHSGCLRPLQNGICGMLPQDGLGLDGLPLLLKAFGHSMEVSFRMRPQLLDG